MPVILEDSDINYHTTFYTNKYIYEKVNKIEITALN